MTKLCADRQSVCCCAEPLLQLVATVLQCDVAMLSVVSGDQILVMRNGRLESQADTEASPVKRVLHKLLCSDSCSTEVIRDTGSDPRYANIEVGSQQTDAKSFRNAMLHTRFGNDSGSCSVALNVGRDNANSALITMEAPELHCFLESMRSRQRQPLHLCGICSVGRQTFSVCAAGQCAQASMQGIEQDAVTVET